MVDLKQVKMSGEEGSLTIIVLLVGNRHGPTSS